MLQSSQANISFLNKDFLQRFELLLDFNMLNILIEDHCDPKKVNGADELVVVNW